MRSAENADEMPVVAVAVVFETRKGRRKPLDMKLMHGLKIVECDFRQSILAQSMEPS